MKFDVDGKYWEIPRSEVALKGAAQHLQLNGCRYLGYHT
jgi:hypothetical protein